MQGGKAGYLLSPLSHCPNRGKLCGSDPAFQRKATRADSLAASPFWKAVRLEVRGAEGEPADSRGDGRDDALASELLHERL